MATISVGTGQLPSLLKMVALWNHVTIVAAMAVANVPRDVVNPHKDGLFKLTLYVTIYSSYLGSGK